MIQLFLGALGLAIGPLVRVLLVQLGVGVISFVAVTSLINSLFNTARSSFIGLPGDIAAICQIGGIGEAMGIIAAAVAVRVGMQFIKRFGILPS